MAIQFYQLKSLPINDPKVKEVPSWVWKCCIDDEGKLYVPSLLTPISQALTALMVMADGVQVILDEQDSDASYIEAEWVAKTFPETQETIKKMTGRVTELLMSGE